jgi:hypothetical protein
MKNPAHSAGYELVYNKQPERKTMFGRVIYSYFLYLV